MIYSSLLEESQILLGYFEELRSKGNEAYSSLRYNCQREDNGDQSLLHIYDKECNVSPCKAVIDGMQGNIFLYH